MRGGLVDGRCRSLLGLRGGVLRSGEVGSGQERGMGSEGAGGASLRLEFTTWLSATTTGSSEETCRAAGKAGSAAAEPAVAPLAHAGPPPQAEGAATQAAAAEGAGGPAEGEQPMKLGPRETPPRAGAPLGMADEDGSLPPPQHGPQERCRPHCGCCGCCGCCGWLGVWLGV